MRPALGPARRNRAGPCLIWLLPILIFGLSWYFVPISPASTCDATGWQQAAQADRSHNGVKKRLQAELVTARQPRQRLTGLPTDRLLEAKV